MPLLTSWNNAGMSKTCLVCKIKFSVSPSRFATKKYCSMKCYSFAQRTESGNIRLSGWWSKMRLKTLIVQLYRCSFCGLKDKSGTSLEVHHINGRNDREHLSVLCKNCHHWLHDIVFPNFGLKLYA